MQLLFQPDIASAVLDQDESRHCIQVLRKKVGDMLAITDGAGNLYQAEITSADKRKVEFRVVDQSSDPVPSYSRQIAIAPTKNIDRLEWFVEKCVELGVDEIIFMICDHSERRHVKLERLQKKAISAMKQSLKYRLPLLRGPLPFDELLASQASQRFIAYVDQKNTHLKEIAKKETDSLILIGPEGDFSEREIREAVSKGFQPISLGASRLRTETAGIAACHILNLINT